MRATKSKYRLNSARAVCRRREKIAMAVFAALCPTLCCTGTRPALPRTCTYTKYTETYVPHATSASKNNTGRISQGFAGSWFYSCIIRPSHRDPLDPTHCPSSTHTGMVAHDQYVRGRASTQVQRVAGGNAPTLSARLNRRRTTVQSTRPNSV